MTAEQAIKILKRDLAIQKEYKALPDSIKALEIAIRSLEIWEQARQMVEQNKDRNIVINYDVVERILMQDILELPSVQPAQKVGHWVITDYEYYDCSVCGESYYNGCESRKEAEERLKMRPYDVYSFCPHCGAKMKEGE